MRIAACSKIFLILKGLEILLYKKNYSDYFRPGDRAPTELMMQQVGLNDQHLKSKPVKEINTILRNCPYVSNSMFKICKKFCFLRFISKLDVRNIKARRRTLKNRGYAHSCRMKKGIETKNRKEQLKSYVTETSQLLERIKYLEAKVAGISSSACSRCKMLIDMEN